MNLNIKKLIRAFYHPCAVGALFLFAFINPAAAEYGIVDSLNLAPFVPIVLDAFMTVATAGYDFFVARGTGIIYILIWGWLAVSMGLTLIKMYFPTTWLSFFGFRGGGEMYSGNIGGMKIAENMLKPALRAIIATTVLLQLKPIYITDWLVDPFLRFGATYTESIISNVNMPLGDAPQIKCPPDIIERGWVSADACNFLVQPVSILSHANNQVIKRGFEFITRGLSGLMTLIPHGGEDFLNLITGILLVSAFVSSNFFMGLLIIGGIFNFGMALILYPFNVLTWVIKPKNPDVWLDFLPPFDGIIKALKQLIITMIACAFILVINIAVIKSLFNWNTSVFVVAAGGSAAGNVPTMESAMGFGAHSIVWLSSILTFYLMARIFELTRAQLDKYIGKDADSLYKKASSDSKTLWKNARNAFAKIKKATSK